MLVLGIESTCDETACSVVKDGKEILSNQILSQAEIHKVYGGVVPEISCRNHVDSLIPLLDSTLKDADIQLSDINLIAVSHAPGLVGALLIGLNAAKALSLALEVPFVGVNHVEAHLYAALMSNDDKPDYPCLGVVLSGGHTAIWLMKDLGDYTLLGQTVDDAIGEAFDKVAKMLSLPYPGGPHVEALAAKGKPSHFSLRAGNVKGNPIQFSFSGLKTAVLYAMKDPSYNETQAANLAYAFQEAALNNVIDKTLLAIDKYKINDVILGGGVTHNLQLRKLFSKRAPHLKFFWPTQSLSLDNAAMIAGLGYHVFTRKGFIGDSYSLSCQTRLPLNR